MRLTSLSGLATIALLIPLMTGCGVIYSQQRYGSPRTQNVSQGANKLEVFANMGEPDSIYKSGNQEVFIYRYAEGKNVLGLFSKIRRSDAVVIMDQGGTVRWVSRIPVGSGYTWLSGPFTDATHPVRTDTLLSGPDNYELQMN